MPALPVPCCVRRCHPASAVRRRRRRREASPLPLNEIEFLHHLRIGFSRVVSLTNSPARRPSRSRTTTQCCSALQPPLGPRPCGTNASPRHSPARRPNLLHTTAQSGPALTRLP